MKRDLLNEFDNWKTEAKERGEWPPRCSCGARPKWDELDLLKLYLAGMAYGRAHEENLAGDVAHGINHIRDLNKLS